MVLVFPSPHSFGQLFLRFAVDGMTHVIVSSGDTWVLLWHELSPGTSPELCSPAKALIAAPSDVTQLHRQKC